MFAAFRLVLTLLFVLSLLINLSAQNENPGGEFRTVSTTDETAVQSLITQYFNALSKKDIFTATSLWSGNSTEFKSNKQTLEKLFTGHENISVKKLAFEKMEIEGEKIKVRLTIEIAATEIKSGKSVQELGSNNRIFYLVKEEGNWKISRESSAEKELALLLVAAKTEAAQNGLLSENQQLINKHLAKEFYREISSISEKLSDKEILENYNFGYKIAEQSGSKVTMANFLGRTGNFFVQKGNLIKALEYHQKALPLREEIGDPQGMSVVLSNLGMVFLFQANYAQAVEYFEKSVKSSESVGEKFGMAIDLYNLGNAYRFRGDYANAMFFYQKSLSLGREVNDPEIIGGVANNIADLYNAQGNYEQAIKYFNIVGEKFGQNSTYFLNGLGESYSLQGQYPKGNEYYEKAFVIKEESGDKLGAAENLTRIGKNYSLLGDYSKASEYFWKTLEQYVSQNNESAVFADKMINVLVEVAKIQLSQEKFTEAQKSIERAESYYLKFPELQKNWELYTLWGQINQRLNRHSQSRLNIDKSIEIIEQQRLAIVGGEIENQRFFAGKVSPYHLMVDLLISQNDLTAAFAYAERAKSRALLDVLQNGKVNYNKPLTASEKEQERRLKNELISFNAQISKENERKQPDKTRLADLQNQLQNKRLEFEDFQTRLYAAHPELRVQRAETKPISLEEINELSDDNNALLEYVVAENKTFLFVLTKNASQKIISKVYPIEIKKKDLTGKTEVFRSKLAKGDLDFGNHAQDLYDLLLKPAEAQLKNKTNLIIVPDSALWDLPFQALQTTPNKYLIETAAVSYAPSLTALREMAKKNQGKQFAGATLLAFGNPIVGKETSTKVKQVFMGEKLEPLPEAERLVTSLGKLYGANKSKVFIGAEAQEATAKTETPKFQIVQFATHGILNDINPMYSHIVLAQKENNSNEDGLLEAWEMKDLNLRADMVILSACETARGQVSGGEGVIGMSWALFIAGAPTTVASQWKVESSSTTELMLEFHRQLLTAKNITKAEALRRASLKLMKSPQYKHPSYWAGFVMVGDGF